MLIGGSLKELVSAKADVAELKVGDDNFGVPERVETEAVVGGRDILQFCELACPCFSGAPKDTVEHGPSFEVWTWPKLEAVFARSRTESIVKHCLPAGAFTLIGNENGCGLPGKADFDKRR